MSKGFHRLPADTPWSNRGLIETKANHRRTPPTEAHDDAMRPIVAAVEFDPAPKMTRDQATSAGFTGNSCVECGSMQMVRNGTCEKCNSCGATTGCS